MDATYGRVRGRWVYAYRAIDQQGQVVDVFVSKRRNAQAAQAFLSRAFATTGVTPRRISTDQARGSPPALRGRRLPVEHRRSRYLNNRLERDHRHLTHRLRPMRGFKRLSAADIVSRGHALMQNLRTGFSTLTVRIPRPRRLARRGPNSPAQSDDEIAGRVTVNDAQTTARPLACNRTFNPHPVRRPGATLRSAAGGSLTSCFNPHPVRRPGATCERKSPRISVRVVVFQSSPGPETGCNSMSCTTVEWWE